MRLKTEARRQAIIQAAANVFLSKGFAGTKMTDIALAANSSKATLYSYFDSKELLFLVTVQTLAEAQFGTAFAILARPGPFRETLQAFGEAMVKATTSDDALALLRLVVIASIDPLVGRKLFEEGPELADLAVIRALDAAMARGEIKRCDAGTAANHLRGLLESEYLYKRISGAVEVPSSKEIEGSVTRAIDVFWAAYAANSLEQDKKMLPSRTRP